MHKYGDIGQYREPDERIEITTFGSTVKSYMTRKGVSATLMSLGDCGAIVIKTSGVLLPTDFIVGGTLSAVVWEEPDAEVR